MQISAEYIKFDNLVLASSTSLVGRKAEVASCRASTARSVLRVLLSPAPECVACPSQLNPSNFLSFLLRFAVSLYDNLCAERHCESCVLSFPKTKLIDHWFGARKFKLRQLVLRGSNESGGAETFYSRRPRGAFPERHLA